MAPRRVPTCRVPVMFSADVATGLIGHLVMGISGSNLYRKSSFLLDSLGTQLLPEWFQIQERPHVLKGIASAPFDSEGLITKDLEIIKDGVLQTYLATGYAARKLGISQLGTLGEFTIGILPILGKMKPSF